MPPNINIKQIWDVMNRSGKYFDNVLTKVRKVKIIYLIISIIIYNIMKSMVEILQKISQFCSTCIL